MGEIASQHVDHDLMCAGSKMKLRKKSRSRMRGWDAFCILRAPFVTLDKSWVQNMFHSS